jgi:hypothetical protein
VDLALQAGEVSNETVKYGLTFAGLDPRVTALARPRRNCTSKLQTHSLVREGVPWQETLSCQTENKNLVTGGHDSCWTWSPE